MHAHSRFPLAALRGEIALVSSARNTESTLHFAPCLSSVDMSRCGGPASIFLQGPLASCSASPLSFISTAPSLGRPEPQAEAMARRVIAWCGPSPADEAIDELWKDADSAEVEAACSWLLANEGERPGDHTVLRLDR